MEYLDFFETSSPPTPYESRRIYDELGKSTENILAVHEELHPDDQYSSSSLTINEKKIQS